MPNLNLNDPMVIMGLIALTVFDLVLKGVALWSASKNHQRNWFIALFLVNSVGILPLIYLKFFQPKKKRS